jgi:nitroreductase
MSTYQERYEAHQARKRDQLEHGVGEDRKGPPRTYFEALEARRSQRLFTPEPVGESAIENILMHAVLAPSSCNRHGVRVKVVTDRYEKNLLSGLLVGGVGWAHRAGALFLLLADPVAYASPNEKEFMHYLDAGFLAMTMWLAAESCGLGAAYINPNVTDKDTMSRLFTGEHIFCGALAVGHYEKRALVADRITSLDLLVC